MIWESFSRPRGKVAARIFLITLAMISLLFHPQRTCAAGGETGSADASRGEVSITVMSFNVLCSFCPEFGKGPADPWKKRLKYFAGIFQRHHPDLIGLQELSSAAEVRQVLRLNPDYEALYYTEAGGVPRQAYPDACILYLRERFEVIARGAFWLSETPDKPWSRGWASDMQFPRVVAWAHLKDRSSGRELYFATTHFDPNAPNQEKSAPIAIERMAAWAEAMPVIFVGDFNSSPETAAYRALTGEQNGLAFRFQNAYDAAQKREVDTNQTPPPESRAAHAMIDHIFLAGKAKFRVPLWVVDMHVYGQSRNYPSDHRAIVAHILIIQT